MPECYIVLGVPRSGTSLAAGILHHLGIPMGMKIHDPSDPNRWDMGGPDEWNPTGYFEDALHVNFCYDVQGWPWRDAGPLKPPQLRRLQEISNLRRADAKGSWGVKTAGLVYCSDELLSVIGNAAIVTTSRALDKSLTSWSAMFGVSRGESERILRPIHVRLKAAMAKHSRQRVLSLDCACQHDWARQLANFTRRPLTDAAQTLYNPRFRHF